MERNPMKPVVYVSEQGFRQDRPIWRYWFLSGLVSLGMWWALAWCVAWVWFGP